MHHTLSMPADIQTESYQQDASAVETPPDGVVTYFISNNEIWMKSSDNSCRKPSQQEINNLLLLAFTLIKQNPL